MITTTRTCTLALALLTPVFGACSGPRDVPALIASAQDHRAKNEHRAAMIELKNALAENPENGEARYLLGVIYDETDEPVLAEKELERAVKLGYDPAKSLPALGRVLLVSGQYQKLIDTIAAGSSDDPVLTARILAMRGQALMAMGRTDEARDPLARALALQPDLPDVLIAHARLASADRKPEAAWGQVQRALEKDPQNLDAWILKGDLARSRDDSDTAIQAYEKALDARPLSLAARLSLARVHIDQGRVDEARKQVQQARKDHPGSIMTTYTHAVVEFRARNLPAARDATAQVLKVAPDHLPTLVLAGAIAAHTGAYAQAQTYLERVLNEMPANLYARKLLVTALAQTGQIQRASDVLQPALSQAPKDAEVLRLAGEIHLRTNEFDKANDYLQRAAKVEPRNALVRTRLAASRMGLGETEQAFEDLEAASGLDQNDYRADVTAVIAHLQRKQFDEAMAAVKRLEQKQPGNPLTYNLRAAVHSGKGDVAAARRDLQRALEIQWNYVPAAINLARLDLNEKKPEAARGRLESILRKEPGNVQALVALAELGPALGASAQQRIEWLDRAAKAGPGLVRPQLLLARAYVRNREFSRALEVVQRLDAAHPDNAQVLDMLGAVQLDAGQKQQALSTYQRLAALQPDSGYALYRLGLAQLHNSNPAARATLQKAVALQPDLRPAQIALVQAHSAAGEHGEALKIAQRLQKQHPDEALGYSLEGDIFMAQKKFRGAVKAYESAFERQPSGPIVIKVHAAHTRAGEAKEASRKVSAWLEKAPDDLLVRRYAAETSLAQEDYRAAAEHYERLLTRQPDNPLALNNLAWAYHKLDDPRALDTAERAMRAVPDNPAVADTLGWIVLHSGDTKRAVDLLQRAAAAAPRNASIRYHLAYALYKAGREEKAREQLKALLASDRPFRERADAQALLARLGG